MASTFSTAVALRGEQTDGAISVVENTVPAQWDGPPLHHHGSTRRSTCSTAS